MMKQPVTDVKEKTFLLWNGDEFGDNLSIQNNEFGDSAGLFEFLERVEDDVLLNDIRGPFAFVYFR